MKRQIKNNSYFLYGNKNVHDIIIGFFIVFSANIYGIVMTIRKANLENWSVDSIVALLLLLAPFLVIPYIIWKYRIMARYLMRCRFDYVGIRCFYPLWGRFSLNWEDVRTYGLINSSAGYKSMVLVFLSTDPHEMYDRQKIYEISKKRLVFEYRPGFWEAFVEFMPNDIRKRLDESMSSGRGCYVKR